MTTRERRELVIVGGGPAGLAAAIEARRAGLDTCLVEAQPRIGGRLAAGLDGPWRAGARRLIADAQSSGAEICTASLAWGIWGREVMVSSAEQPRRLLVGDQVILATGAYARPVVFPGWTLPGVMTATGARRLLQQRVSPGGRVLVAGYGRAVESIANELQRHKVSLVDVVDACAATVGSTPEGPAATGARMPIRRRQLVLRVEGEREVERAVVARVDADWRPIPGTARTVEVDTLVLAFGSVPSNELSRLAGCDHIFSDSDPNSYSDSASSSENLGGLVAVRDAWMRTSVPGVLVAGDAGGVRGPATAIDQGRLAGIAAALDAGRLAPAEAAQRAAAVRRRLAGLERGREHASIGPGIDELADPDTVVCRCEDVTAAQIAAAIFEGTSDLGTLVGETRAGMGSCQGRNCARQIAAIVAQHAGRRVQDMPTTTPRPPAMLVPMGALAERPPEMQPLADLPAGLRRPG